MGAVYTEGGPNYGSTVLTGSGNYTLNVEVLDSLGQLDHVDLHNSETGELLTTLSIPNDGDGYRLARSIALPMSVSGIYYTAYTGGSLPLPDIRLETKKARVSPCAARNETTSSQTQQVEGEFSLTECNRGVETHAQHAGSFPRNVNEDRGGDLYAPPTSGTDNDGPDVRCGQELPTPANQPYTLGDVKVTCKKNAKFRGMVFYDHKHFDLVRTIQRTGPGGKWYLGAEERKIGSLSFDRLNYPQHVSAYEESCDRGTPCNP